MGTLERYEVRGIGTVFKEGTGPIPRVLEVWGINWLSGLQLDVRNCSLNHVFGFAVKRERGR